MKKLIVILGVAGVSLSAVFVRIADAPAMVLVLYRVGMASVVLLPFFIREMRGKTASIQPRYFLLSALAGMLLALHFTVYFESLRHTDIASAVVLVDTEVFFIALAGFFLFRERLGKKPWFGIAAAFFGSAVIALSDAGGGNGNFLYGDLLALSGAVLLAGYTLIGSVCRKKISTLIYTFIAYSSASFTILLILFFSDVKIIGYGKINWLAGAGLALFCTLLGHSLFSWGLKYEKAAYVSAVKMLEPVFATVLGALLFCEIPSLFVVAGGILVVSGIVYYTYVSSSRYPMEVPHRGSIEPEL